VSLVLGVDVGSQSIKAVIVDESGDVVSSGSAPLTMVHEHGGWADQDPAAYRTALRDAVRMATDGTPANRIVAMGLGSQVDGVVACDADGTPLRSAIIWLDKRATDQCDRLVSAVGSEQLAERTGLVADASHSAPKMIWIHENEPQVWQRAAMFAPVGAYVLHHLSGSWAQDAANASSTMVYDVTKGDFDAELCQAAGLDPAMLPQVRPSTDVVGTLRPDVAADLGLPDTCAVVVGTGDEHAASVGAGAIEPGVIVDVTGTAEPVTTVGDEPVRDPLGVVETHGHAVPGRWLIENPGFVSGGRRPSRPNATRRGSRRKPCWRAARRAPRTFRPCPWCGRYWKKPCGSIPRSACWRARLWRRMNCAAGSCGRATFSSCRSGRCTATNCFGIARRNSCPHASRQPQSTNISICHSAPGRVCASGPTSP